MKKLVVLLTLLLLCLAGCRSREAGETVEGMVVEAGGNPCAFAVEQSNGDTCGFLVTEDTELIWEDRSAFRIWEDTAVEYDDWGVFSCDMYVTVEVGAEAQPAEKSGAVRNGWYYARKVTVTGVYDGYFDVAAKPVIYLYPQEETPVTVELDYKGILTCTYPKYRDGWNVVAQSDGTLTDENGLEYNYLYWEGIWNGNYDFSEGFCVRGADSAKFLEEILPQLGLNRREANEFIVYWLPQLEKHPYNLISFQQENYSEGARLTVSPEPDTVIRVFMAFQPLDEKVEIPPQNFVQPERAGFTLVEWGGTCVER